MKKVIAFVFGVLILTSSLVQASVQSAILNDIVEESPSVWGIESSDSNVGLRFVPDKGGIKICKVEKKITIGFYLSDDDLVFYNQKFSNGTQKPIGFEVEIIDYSKVFNSKNILGYKQSFSQNVRYNDNSMLDNEHIYSICINNPSKLEANKWHTVEIYFSNYNNVAPATFAVQFQLVGDIRKLSEDYSSIYDKYSVKVKTELLSWWTVLGGIKDIDGNNFFNLRKPNIRFWRDKFFGWPEGRDSGYDRVFWRMGERGEMADYKPYSCNFGSDPWDENPNSSNLNDGSICNDAKVGSGSGDVATDPPNPRRPDFLTDKVEIRDSSGNEKYIFKHTDDTQIHEWLTNEGQANWNGNADDIYVRCYLSQGTKVDSSSKWQRVTNDEIKKGNLDIGETKHEEGTVNLYEWYQKGYITPGKYHNYVCCVDREHDSDNGDGEIDEIHESNNCNKNNPAVFFVEEMTIPESAPNQENLNILLKLY